MTLTTTLITFRNFKLSVHVPPSIDGPQVVDVAIVLGHSTTLECDVYAVPSAHVQWMKDGGMVDNREGHLTVLSGGTKMQIGEKMCYNLFFLLLMSILYVETFTCSICYLG